MVLIGREPGLGRVDALRRPPAPVEVVRPGQAMAAQLEKNLTTPHAGLVDLAKPQPQAPEKPTVTNATKLPDVAATIPSGQEHQTAPAAQLVEEQTGKAKAEGLKEVPMENKANSSESPNAKRMAELRPIIESGKQTPAQLQEYTSLARAENADASYEALQQKVLNGSASEAEVLKFQYLSERRNGTIGATGTEASPQPVDKVEAAKMKVLEAASKENGDLAQAMTELVQAKVEQLKLNPIQDPELIRQSLDNLFNMSASRFPREAQRELAVQTRVRERLQKILTLEMQVMMGPRYLSEIKKQADATKTRLRGIESKANGNMQDKATQNARMEYYGLLAHLADLKAEAIRTQHSTDTLRFEVMDLRRDVKRMLGMYKGFGGLASMTLDWVAAKSGKEITFQQMNLDSTFDYA